MSEWTITEAICGNERMTGRNKKKPKARVCNGHGGPFNEIPRCLVLGPNVPRVAPICRRLRVYQDETPLTSCWARSGNGRATGPEFGDFCCFAAWIEWLDWFDVASLALQLPLFAFTAVAIMLDVGISCHSAVLQLPPATSTYMLRVLSERAVEIQLATSTYLLNYPVSSAANDAFHIQ